MIETTHYFDHIRVKMMKMVKDGPQMGLKHGKNLIETRNSFNW